MKIVLKTERLILRELTMEDAETLSLVLSDPESMKHYPHPFSAEEVKNWIARNIERYKKDGFGLWAVILKDSGELIGDCGITVQNIEGIDYPEIGYHIRKQFCRKGYASEAARTCMHYAFTKKNEECVISYMRQDNTASRRVAEKNGMTFVRTFCKTVFGTRVNDEVLYRIKKTDYDR